MINDLQELLNELKDGKQTSQSSAEYWKDKNDTSFQVWMEVAKVYAWAELKLTQILQAHDELNNDLPPQLNKHDVIGWKAFNDEKPPLYTTVCMCYKDGRIDGGVFNHKDEVDFWMQDYNPVAWVVVALPSFL